MNYKTLLLVDPIHSAAYLSKRLKEYAIRSVALFSDMRTIAEFNRPSQTLFDRQIHITDESLDQILSLIDERVDFVLNGSDQHVNLCERIAFALTPALSNNPNTSVLRGNKFSQQEAMKQNDLPSVKQIIFNVEDKNYAALQQLDYPVFAKPLNGGGSIGIFKADCFDDLVNKLKSAPTQVNFDEIKEYLIQEFIKGDEIIIDAFSCKGKHYISHVFTYKKNEVRKAPIYRTIESIDDIHLIEKAIEFTQKVLDCCQYYNGFSHIELFYLKNQEFKLIELNPRISGVSGFVNMMAEKIGLKSQVNLLGEFLHGNLKTGSDFYQQRGDAKVLLLYHHQPIDFSGFDSYQSHIYLNHRPFIEKRAPDLTDLRQIVLMHHENKAILERECASILKKDKF